MIVASLAIFLFMPRMAGAETIHWTVQKGTGFDGSAALIADGSGRIVIGGIDGILTAFGEDGVVAWSLATGGSITGTPAVRPDGSIIVGTAAGQVLEVSSEGIVRWRFATGGPIHSSPALGADGSVYIGSDDGILYSLDENGSEKWRFATTGAIRGAPALTAGGLVCFGSQDGVFRAINEGDGSLDWRFSVGSALTGAPALGDDGTVYLAATDGWLYALWKSGTEGAMKWRFPVGTADIGPPVVDVGAIVYVGSDDGFLYAIRDLSTSGERHWRTELGTPLAGAPLIDANGYVIVATTGGQLHQLSANGDSLWKLSLASTTSSPVLSPDGFLYIGTKETGASGIAIGRLYAVETDSAGLRNEAPWPMFRHDVRHTGRATANLAPSASAGEDREAESDERVTLDATDSTDPDFGIATFSWRQSSGTTVTLDGANGRKPSFQAPETDNEETLTFTLTVTDIGGLTATDEVIVTVQENDNFCFIGTSDRQWRFDKKSP